MKTKHFACGKLAAVSIAAGLFLSSLCTDRLFAVEVIGTSTNTPPPATQPVPILEDAGTNAVSPAPAAPNIEDTLSSEGKELVRLAESGVGEDVLLAYIANCTNLFALTADQIIFLNDIGLSEKVVKAMLDRDTTLVQLAQQRQPVPVPSAQPVPVTTAPTVVSVEQPYYPPTTVIEQPVIIDDSSYFYDALQPYGSWIYINGYGRCWQPTVCVLDHGWRPYGDRGRWLSSDCGWYWQSDYSWGWAPFHYGRWFCDDSRGWVWLPRRTWGPAWVSWRSSADYCGWAPLPPEAHFAAGGGFRYHNNSVGVDFEFGLRAEQYTFVPVARLSDYSPLRYRSAPWEAARFYDHTRVYNHFTMHDNHVISHGIDPKYVAREAHTEIRTAVVRETPATGTGYWRHHERLEKSGNSLVISHPTLPPVVRHNETKGIATPPVRTGAFATTGSTHSPRGFEFRHSNPGPSNPVNPITAPPISTAQKDARSPVATVGSVQTQPRTWQPVQKSEMYSRGHTQPAPAATTEAGASFTPRRVWNQPVISSQPYATIPQRPVINSGSPPSTTEIPVAPVRRQEFRNSSGADYSGWSHRSTQTASPTIQAPPVTTSQPTTPRNRYEPHQQTGAFSPVQQSRQLPAMVTSPRAPAPIATPQVRSYAPAPVAAPQRSYSIPTPQVSRPAVQSAPVRQLPAMVTQPAQSSPAPSPSPIDGQRRHR